MKILPNHKANSITGLGIEQIGKVVYLFYKSNSDGSKKIRLAKSLDGMEFSLLKVLKENYTREKISPEIKELIKPRPDHFDNKLIEIEGVVKIDGGKLIVYHNRDLNGEYQVGVAIVKNDKSHRIIFRGETPLWESSSAWMGKKIEFIGLASIDGQIIGYWGVDDSQIQAVIYPSFKLRNPQTARSININLKKVIENPLISPNSENSWEAFTTFNPAAIYEGGKVHILYRAQGFDYVSVVGYASSSDGVHIEERLDYPIYRPTQPFEWVTATRPEEVNTGYMSGGGYGGVEDPRITRVGDRLYMSYVAFNGIDPPRVALTSISVDDFLNHRWLWEKPVLISPPGVVDKSCVIFPEKVNGKYVIMHRIFPNILIDFVDSLDFDGNTWLKGEFKIPPRLNMWDSRKIGAGAPPIKTKDGWLLIYQSVDDRDDKKYLIGAMLLDLENPAKVLHRSKLPILRPLEKYENEGFKAGVVYPCGAVVINDTLFVYYGGADSYVCVATANLDDFLNQLTYTEKPILEPAKIGRIK
jgi:predicted GH43/DUF377 family glycosyl hydrolase